MANHLRRNLTIVELLIQGKSQKDIAKVVGITKQRVSQILREDDTCKEILKREQQRLIAHSPEATNTIINLMRNSEDEKVRQSSAVHIHKTIGIMPSHSQSVYIQTLNIQSNIVIDTATSRAIDDMLEYKRSLLPSTVSPPTDASVIDVDGVVVSEGKEG